MKNLKTLSKVIVAAGMTALAVACSKGSSNSNPVVNPGLYPNGCLQCVGGIPAGAAPLLTNVQFSTYGGMSGMVNLGGTGSAQLSPYAYQGPVAPYPVSPYGNGYIQLTSPYCSAMPGTYTIVGVTGNYLAQASYSGIVDGVTIQAQGASGTITIQIYTGEIVFGTNRLGIGTGLMTTNGQSCGSIATN